MLTHHRVASASRLAWRRRAIVDVITRCRDDAVDVLRQIGDAGRDEEVTSLRIGRKAAGRSQVGGESNGDDNELHAGTVQFGDVDQVARVAEGTSSSRHHDDYLHVKSNPLQAIVFGSFSLYVTLFTNLCSILPSTSNEK